ncbi:hypothetical protein K503DRAFT_778959 [Rhizopogon vinicolor AM-OR11-026]|uniref:Crinkler effector protein N-terminal domain-containing protein n=1 Tax=Rhizopogon vinicolor AM-OR11-026 TaxID=1314800 RepID=A0A1B7NG88_9AGAM|nr:hypothetical protein K503DRAFT_778959 [Rhizopogon vinicolor AM-OR11-026]
MEFNYTLSCLVFGDGPSHIFQIGIASTKTVDALRNLIKDTEGHAFRDVAARYLKLWQFNLPIAGDTLDDLKPDPKQSLSPWSEILSVFEHPPEDKRLHIVVRGHLTRRVTYLKRRTGAPSKWAHPTEFAKLQDKQLSEQMCIYYDNELKQMHAFSKLFRYLEIELDPATIGSTKRGTDGHLLSTCGKFAVMAAVRKNEIGSGGWRPVCAGNIAPPPDYAGLFQQTSLCKRRRLVLWELSNKPSRLKKLRDLYSKPELIPRFSLRDENLVPTLGCPYPRSYHDSTNVRHDFSYDRDENQTLRKRLIFFGETINDAARKKLCIKFVRHYSREAHDFCAEKGHAPKLIACIHLSAGWIMVVMDALDIDYGYFSQWAGSYRRLTEMTVSARQLLQEPVTSLIQQLHQYPLAIGRPQVLVKEDGLQSAVVYFYW